MKQCKKCKEIKELNEFYKHPQMKDGHINICIKCKRKEQINIRNNNLEYYQNYDKNRPNKEERNKLQKEYAATEKGKEVKSRAIKNYRENNPIKYKAHGAVNNAIRDGKLIKPKNCETCNIECKPHGHHDDYTKPLEVRWLCDKCHKKWHKENGQF